jgi:hypothetical protein
VLTLVSHQHNPQAACEQWFLDKASDEAALDMIDHVFQVVFHVMSDFGTHERSTQGVMVSASAAINELSHRLLESGLGFQHENGELRRIDSHYVHAEIVKPALALLNGQMFEKANEDFRMAHRHYRERHYKDCVVACQRAFESTLKAICTAKNWEYSAGDRTSELVAKLRKHGLFPSYLDKGLDSYIAALKTGLPGVRNHAGGHGEEPAAPPVPDYIAGYALHLSAANVVMAVAAFRKLPTIN